MITAYGDPASANGYQLCLAVEQLEVPDRRVTVDCSRGESRTPEYLAKNPNGKVPMLETDDGRILVESNAILYWLADGSALFPADSWQRAQALSWMFFEQYSHEPAIAVARFIRGWMPLDSPRRGAELNTCRQRGEQALVVMDNHLKSAPWFTGPDYGIADIALLAYTDVAADGGFDLSAFPAIIDWLARVRVTRNFVPMPAPAAENAALFAASSAPSFQ